MKNRTQKITFLLLATALILVACGTDTSYLLVMNGSSADICEVNVVADSAQGWGANLISGDTIDAGTEYEISDIESGIYDLRFVPCDESSFTITEDQNIDLNDNIEYSLFDI
jgi:hypothetical protein